MIIRKIPAIPSLLTGALLGAVCAVVLQPNIIQEIGAQTKILITDSDNFETTWRDTEGNLMSASDINNIQPGNYRIEIIGNHGVSGTAQFEVPAYGEETDKKTRFTMYQNGMPTNKIITATVSRNSYAKSAYIATMASLTDKVGLSAESDELAKLIDGKGMFNMLNTIWLILCAMAFGGLMEKTGLLQRITEAIIRRAKSRGGLISATAGTCVFFNATASDQYLAIVVPGRMFASTYRDRNLKPENLSRTLEDAGTVTSVLVPWNTCGAAQADVLHVSVYAFAPYCFFNILSPLITIAYGYLGIKVPLIDDKKHDNLLNKEDSSLLNKSNS